MLNPFVIADRPAGHPSSIIVGAYLRWWLDLDFDSALYSLKYTLRIGTNTYDVAGVFADDRWTFTLLGATSSAWTTGKHSFDLVLTEIASSENAVVETGFIKVISATEDRRSHAQVMVDKIESILAGRADADVSSYTIKSRSLTKMTIKELMDWRNYYLDEVRREANGGKLPKLQVRFTG